MGENCSACSRLIVDRRVKDELLECIVARTREWRIGDPLDPMNHLGAMIDAEHCKKVTGYLSLGADSTTIAGGSFDGPYVEPTIFDDVKPDSRLATEEIFGPLLSVIPVSSTDEAIQIANATDYGLAASVFSANGRQAIRTAKAIFGGRDNGMHAHEQYTELKTLWIDLTDPDDGDRVA